MSDSGKRLNIYREADDTTRQAVIYTELSDIKHGFGIPISYDKYSVGYVQGIEVGNTNDTFGRVTIGDATYQISTERKYDAPTPEDIGKGFSFNGTGGADYSWSTLNTIPIYSGEEMDTTIKIGVRWRNRENRTPSGIIVRFNGTDVVNRYISNNWGSFVNSSDDTVWYENTINVHFKAGYNYVTQLYYKPKWTFWWIYQLSITIGDNIATKTFTCGH